MLLSIYICNYALIEELEISFEDGFSTITGETGAGKSIIMGALSLLMGQRAEAAVLRNANIKSVIEAQWNIEKYSLKGFFELHQIEWESVTIVRREILPNGKSRAFINDTPVNIQVLKDFSDSLIDIHSQHQNLALKSEDFQLEVIDSVSDNSQILHEYQNVFFEYEEIIKKINQLKNLESKSKSDLDYTKFIFDELDKAKLQEGEFDKISDELKILSNSELIINTLGNALQVIKEDDDNFLLKFKTLKNSFESIAMFHSGVGKIADRIESLHYEFIDIANDIDSLFQQMNIDPERISVLTERIDLLNSLMNKHRVSTEIQLIELRNQLDETLRISGNYSEEIEKNEKKLKESEIILSKLATNLSENRKKSSDLLKQRLVELLKKLGMQHALINIHFDKTKEYTQKGTDVVQFLFTANINTPLLPIAQVASGGEISRVMLCLKYFISEKKKLPTLIFDEIDTGVSGEIAYSMGDLMKLMSQNIQIVCITHLPQIAAAGNHQYKVFKTVTQQKSVTQIKKLSDDERVQEIAQIISGSNVSDAAIENAKILLKFQ